MNRFAAEETTETTPSPSVATNTDAQEILSAYKLYKLSVTLRRFKCTITKPTAMELYNMIKELTNLGTYFRASFRYECRKHGIKMFSRDELKALQDAAYAEFMQPVENSEPSEGC